MAETQKPSPTSERPIGAEESLAQSLRELTTPKTENIEMFTELDDEEIINGAALIIWAKETGFDVFKDFFEDFCRLRVSRFRQGRREIALTIGLAAGSAGAKTPKSLRDMLSGLRM